MKFLNKTFLFAAVSAVAAIGLVACKSESSKTDLFAIDSDLARSNMTGYYVYQVVDTANMNVTIKEWNLTDGGRGYFSEVSTGNNLDVNTRDSLTWSAEMSEDNLSMIVYGQLKGEDLTFEWQNGVIETKDYLTSKSAISLADVLRSVNDNFANVDFINSDVKYHTRIDTVPYLAWKTTVKFVEPEDTTAAKKELYDENIVGNEDTLLWYCKTHDFGALTCLEVDTAENKIISTVYVDPKASESARTKGKHGVTYLVAYETTEPREVKIGPEYQVTCELQFSRQDKKNVANYKYQYQSWSREYYDESPLDLSKVKTVDSTYVISNAVWTPVTFYANSKFNVLLDGTEEISVKETVGGVETRNEEVKNDILKLMQFSGFTPNKEDAKGNKVLSNLEYNEMKFLIK